MSRALTDIVRAYKNMDIENLPSEVAEKPKGGLLAKSRDMSMSEGLDYDNPAVRVGKQMQIIRRHRDEINNDRTG